MAGDKIRVITATPRHVASRQPPRRQRLVILVARDRGRLHPHPAAFDQSRVALLRSLIELPSHCHGTLEHNLELCVHGVVIIAVHVGHGVDDVSLPWRGDYKSRGQGIALACGTFDQTRESNPTMSVQPSVALLTTSSFGSSLLAKPQSQVISIDVMTFSAYFL